MTTGFRLLIVLALALAVLLPACQPAATPQPPTISPTEPLAPTILPTETLAPTSTSVATLASSVNDLFGVWWFPSPGVKLEFKADGTYRIFYVDTTIDEGNFTFADGKVIFVTPGSGGCRGTPATYDAYVTKQDSKTVSLRLQVVGSDPCPGRGDLTSHESEFLNP